MYHISDIKKLERCPRLFWLSKREKKEFVAFINYNENMMELVKEKLALTEYFEGKVNDDPALAMAAYQEGKTLLNARFAYEELRIKIPVLLQIDGKVKLVFTYKSCFPKEHEAKHIADTISVLELLGITVDVVTCIHLNANYIREDVLDVHQLLIESEYFYNAKNHAHHRILTLVKRYKRDVLEPLQQLKIIEGKDDIAVERTTQCTRGNKCTYYDTCFPEKPAATSIMNLVQSAYKFEMLEEGIKELQEVDIDRIEGTRHQYAQIMAAKQGGLYIDKVALRCWRDSHITYPLSYLDFEWETFAFPPYKGMRPFDVLTFQYSLHVEETKGAAITHEGFIGEGDCRITFIEDLLNKIPSTGTILVYNMEGAEKLRLVQLSKQYPQYAQQLEQVWSRMIDLSLPFSSGNIYDIRMVGLFSLKTLVPIFSDYTYADLDISYGVDAVQGWRSYCEAEGLEKETLYKQLTQYCSMDTYAEYLVYHALEEMMENEE